MTSTTDGPKQIQRYKIGYRTDEWGMRSSTPSAIPDPTGLLVKFDDAVQLVSWNQDALAELEQEARLMRARMERLQAELDGIVAAIGADGVNEPLMGRAAPPTAQAKGWRSIETAPRDGTEVLANAAGLGHVVAYWDDGESQWGTGLGYLDSNAPTHWMPLPPLPHQPSGWSIGKENASLRAQQPAPQPAPANPDGDELRKIARAARTSASDDASPTEYVLAGWRAALAAQGGK